MTESKVKKYMGVEIQSQPLWDDVSFVFERDFDTERTARLEAERKLEEILSYLPKVPTQPYEKEMAMKIKVLEARLHLYGFYVNDIKSQCQVDLNIDQNKKDSAVFDTALTKIINDINGLNQELEQITEEGCK